MMEKSFLSKELKFVLWVDSNQQEYWIEPSEYIGFYSVPDDFDDTYAAKIPAGIRQSIEQLSFDILN